MFHLQLTSNNTNKLGIYAGGHVKPWLAEFKKLIKSKEIQTNSDNLYEDTTAKTRATEIEITTGKLLTAL